MAKAQAKTKEPDYSAPSSNGSRKLPVAHYIRFTETQNTWLHQVAEREGKTIQSFLHEAALTALHENDRRHHERESRRRGLARGVPGDAGTPLPERPRGFGLRAKVEETPTSPYEPPEAPPEAPPPNQPQIVINAGAQAASPVESLAAWVAEAPADKRDERLRTATDVLKAGTKDPAEQRRLARDLDSRVAALGGGSEKKTLSVFDALDSFLGT